jgi:elongator complex protein 2
MTSELTIPTLYPSSFIASVNRSNNCASASLGLHDTSGLIAFGSGNCIAIYDPIGLRILALLGGHTARVTGVAWVSRPDTKNQKYLDEVELVSSATDGTIRIWKATNTWSSTLYSFNKNDLSKQQDINPPWSCTAVLTGHVGSATSVSNYVTFDNSLFIVSCGSDGTLRTWYRAPLGSDFVSIGIVNVPAAGLFETVAISCLPINQKMKIGDSSVNDLANYRIIIAAGGVDCKVHFYIIENNPDKKNHLRCVLSTSGPTDWIRSLSFSHDSSLTDHFGIPSTEVRLAAASKDGKGRLWRISLTKILENETISLPNEENADAESSNFTSNSLKELIKADLDGLAVLQQRRNFSVKLQHENGNFVTCGIEVALDALLTNGHSSWISSVSWHPPFQQGSTLIQPPALVTASMDKSIILWRPELQETSTNCWEGVWRPTVRLGAAGGAVAGFFGAYLVGNATILFAHGYRGSLHSWSRSIENSVAFNDNVFEPLPSAQGHAGAVSDVCWDPDNGNYLVSCSLDSTTRVWTPIDHVSPNEYPPIWMEIGRPQIHGYEMVSVIVPPGSRKYRIISAGDEKVIRIFDATRNFLRTLSCLSGKEVVDNEARVDSAYVPELSLTNRVSTSTSTNDAYRADGLDAEASSNTLSSQSISSASSTFLTNILSCSANSSSSPPLDEDNVQGSRWPEADKLFGHANEVFSLAINSSGTLLASACKARAEAHANILIWELSEDGTAKVIQQLASHKLTVVSLSFSMRHDDGSDVLVSASKDRSLAVWIRLSNEKEFKLASLIPMAHKRIIWCVGWGINMSKQRIFASGARDNILKIWFPDEFGKVATPKLVFPEFSSAVTSVSFAPSYLIKDDTYLLAVGEENGKISLWRIDTKSETWITTILFTLPSTFSPVATVTRIAWRPGTHSPIQIACSSEDESIRIFNVNM